MNNGRPTSTQITIEKDGEMVTGRAAANSFAESYANICDIDIPNERKIFIKDSRKNRGNISTNSDCMENPFSMKEIEMLLPKLQNCKSPGPDKITNEMLKHLGPRAMKVLLGLFNNSWENGNVPQIWREADMIPIHKKGKCKKDVKNYRTISVTSCVGKLMERLINSRLIWYLEDKKLLAAEQAGFRHHHSTEDQVTYIAQKIEDGFQAKKHTLVVWADMEKAFDRVWRDGLRVKLKQIGVAGNLYN